MSTIRELARAAADAITAMVGARDDAVKDLGLGGVVHDFRRARKTCEEALCALGSALYEAHHIMRGDEALAMDIRVEMGLVSPAWALRVVAIGEECGDG